MKKVKLLLGAVMLTAFAGDAYAKVCKKGKPCGLSCISWDKDCKK